MNPQAIEATAERHLIAIRNELSGIFDGWSVVTEENLQFVRENLVEDEESVKRLFIERNQEQFDGEHHTRLVRNWVAYLASIDPTTKSIYTKWLLRRWLAGEFGELLEDVSRAGQPLIDFDRLKSKLPIEQRDINRYFSFQQLLDRLEENRDVVKASKRQQDRDLGQSFIDKGEAEHYVDTDDIRITIPRTIEAARYFGRNTRWCTSAATGNMFSSYHGQGPLYIILFKKTNTRWQFHFVSGQMMDEEDHPISRERIMESAAYQHFDWVQQAMHYPRYFLFVTKPTAKLRTTVLAKDGSIARHILDLTKSEMDLAVSSYPGLVNTDPRFNTHRYRRESAARQPGLVAKMTGLTEAEAMTFVEDNFSAITYVPRAQRGADLMLLAIGQQRRQENRWRDLSTLSNRGFDRREIFLNIHSSQADKYKIDLSHQPVIYLTPADVLSNEILERHRFINGPAWLNLREFAKLADTHEDIEIITRKLYEFRHKVMSSRDYCYGIDPHEKFTLNVRAAHDLLEEKNKKRDRTWHSYDYARWDLQLRNDVFFTDTGA